MTYGFALLAQAAHCHPIGPKCLFPFPSCLSRNSYNGSSLTHVSRLVTYLVKRDFNHMLLKKVETCVFLFDLLGLLDSGTLLFSLVTVRPFKLYFFCHVLWYNVEISLPSHVNRLSVEKVDIDREDPRQNVSHHRNCHSNVRIMAGDHCVSLFHPIPST